MTFSRRTTAAFLGFLLMATNLVSPTVAQAPSAGTVATEQPTITVLAAATATEGQPLVLAAEVATRPEPQPPEVTWYVSRDGSWMPSQQAGFETFKGDLTRRTIFNKTPRIGEYEFTAIIVIEGKPIAAKPVKVSVMSQELSTSTFEGKLLAYLSERGLAIVPARATSPSAPSTPPPRAPTPPPGIKKATAAAKFGPPAQRTGR